MLIIGSVALNLCGIPREPRDLDLIATPDELTELVNSLRPEKLEIRDESHVTLFGCESKPIILEKGGIVEIELVWPGSAAEEIWNSQTQMLYGIASLNTLYWLKMSHRFKKNTPHFEKTRRDILEIRLELSGGQGVFGSPPIWYQRRLEETLNYNHPKLNAGQTKEAFFNGDGVKYYFDHDWVHTVVAGMYSATLPAYQLYQADGETVKCDRVKFESLPFQERLRGVMEEATVLALERSQIPARLDEKFNKDVSPEWSYKYALQKVCTIITSGWFREFAWENYDAAMDNYRRDYSVEFFKAVEVGGI